MALTTRLSYQNETEGNGRYPFTDGATLVSGELTLPPEMIVDACLYPPGGGARQYISGLDMDRGTLTARVSDDSGVLATGSVVLADSRELYLFDTYGRPCGLLLLNADGGLRQGLPEGSHAFTVEGAELTSTCVIPQPQSTVRGFLLDDGSFFSGDVWLVGTGGVVFKADNTLETRAIRMHLVGDPLRNKQSCDQLEGLALVPVKKIRWVLPGGDEFDMVADDYGNAVLLPGANASDQNVFRIEPIQYGLLIRALGNVLNSSVRPSVTKQGYTAGW